jgi:hypothetical protein
MGVRRRQQGGRGRRTRIANPGLTATPPTARPFEQYVIALPACALAPLANPKPRSQLELGRVSAPFHLTFRRSRLMSTFSPDECRRRLLASTSFFGMQVSQIQTTSESTALLTLTVRRWWSLTYRSDILVALHPASSGTSIEVTAELRVGIAIFLLLWMTIWLLVAPAVSSISFRVFVVVVAILPVVPVALVAPLQAQYALNYVKRTLNTALT